MNVATRMRRLLRSYRQKTYGQEPVSDVTVLAHLAAWFLRYDAEELELLVDLLVDKVVAAKQARQSEDQLTFQMVPGAGLVSTHVLSPGQEVKP